MFHERHEPDARHDVHGLDDDHRACRPPSRRSTGWARSGAATSSSRRRCCSRSRSCRCSSSAACRASSWPPRRSTSSSTTPTSSSPTSTTCSSAAASSASSPAIYFWFPKMFGRMMNETLGQDPLLRSRSSSSTACSSRCTSSACGGHACAASPTRRSTSSSSTCSRSNEFMTICALRPGRRARSSSSVNFFCEPVRRAEGAGGIRGTPTRSSGQAPSPPPHGNFGAAMPTVYRGPYEYSVPGVDRGLPAAEPGGAGARAGGHGH